MLIYRRLNSVMDIVNISSIYHAVLNRQMLHYQIVAVLKMENVMDKNRKKLSRRMPYA